MTMLLAISSWDKEHACAAGFSTVLLCTADAGKSWKEIRSLPPSHGQRDFADNLFQDLVLLSDGTGYVLDELHYLYKTRDFGQHWQELSLADLP